mmetsp:Transcript_18848/g.52799  ORF Transcript_18848/g.52799 Transcript_18848/m.52799 type:complete len:294 (+) Transcript_18848:291-1172(+)|eukprot:CAMPEP_0202352732 /NCGR_PEP_ID=MMETSP1126-20121109/8801_1 /ASSEMBLY_ACC=CAM_ASM_000457 /TAXON_ID=3047 /ORGANISM="Dunaliella tertiolecta, Strain CCMP1320" /LENGTH=293 /DNA_ID=CAMNT_0048944991 /DNA_START=331 /DNA_END=1212 /DNA_ORIENTATION=+
MLLVGLWGPQLVVNACVKGLLHTSQGLLCTDAIGFPQKACAHKASAPPASPAVDVQLLALFHTRNEVINEGMQALFGVRHAQVLYRMVQEEELVGGVGEGSQALRVLGTRDGLSPGRQELVQCGVPQPVDDLHGGRLGKGRFDEFCSCLVGQETIQAPKLHLLLGREFSLQADKGRDPGAQDFFQLCLSLLDIGQAAGLHVRISAQHDGSRNQPVGVAGEAVGVGKTAVKSPQGWQLLGGSIGRGCAPAGHALCASAAWLQPRSLGHQVGCQLLLVPQATAGPTAWRWSAAID